MIDTVLQIMVVASLLALLAACAWFLSLGIDGSFQRYAQQMGW